MGLIRAQETLSRSTKVFLEDTWAEMTVVAGGEGDEPPENLLAIRFVARIPAPCWLG